MAQYKRARKRQKAGDAPAFQQVSPKHIAQHVRNPNHDWSKRDSGPRKVYPEVERLTGPAAQHARNLKWLRLAAKCSVGGILHPQKLLFWVCNELRQKDFKRKKNSDRYTMRADARRRVWPVTDAEIAAAVDRALEHDPVFWCPFTVGHDIGLSIEKWQAIGEPTIIRAHSHYELSEALIADNERAARQERNRRYNEARHRSHEEYAADRLANSRRAYCARHGIKERTLGYHLKKGDVEAWLSSKRITELPPGLRGTLPTGLDATYIEDTPRLKASAMLGSAPPRAPASNVIPFPAMPHLRAVAAASMRAASMGAALCGVWARAHPPANDQQRAAPLPQQQEDAKPMVPDASRPTAAPGDDRPDDDDTPTMRELCRSLGPRPAAEPPAQPPAATPTASPIYLDPADDDPEYDAYELEKAAYRAQRAQDGRSPPRPMDGAPQDRGGRSAAPGHRAGEPAAATRPVYSAINRGARQ